MISFSFNAKKEKERMLDWKCWLIQSGGAAQPIQDRVETLQTEQLRECSGGYH